MCVVPQLQLFVAAVEHNLFDRFHLSMLKLVKSRFLCYLNGDVAGDTVKNSDDHFERFRQFLDVWSNLRVGAEQYNGCISIADTVDTLLPRRSDAKLFSGKSGFFQRFNCASSLGQHDYIFLGSVRAF